MDYRDICVFRVAGGSCYDMYGLSKDGKGTTAEDVVSVRNSGCALRVRSDL
jgi:hypothetical protein